LIICRVAVEKSVKLLDYLTYVLAGSKFEPSCFWNDGEKMMLEHPKQLAISPTLKSDGELYQTVIRFP
jgi:hypothetical protein